MRCPVATLLPLVVLCALAPRTSSTGDVLLRLAQRLHSNRLRDYRHPWRRETASDNEQEEERVGEAVVSSVLEGVMGGWLRIYSGAKSAVDGIAEGVRFRMEEAKSAVKGVAEGLQSRVEEAKSAVEGIAKGVQSSVDGAVHDAGEVVSSVLMGANPVIFPGTNWCGVGDRARGYDDTGVFEVADSCCREHDSCPDSIGAGGRKYGLKNEAPFTLSLCECDREFYRCLRGSNSLVAKNIGVMFFNILKIKCFTYDYPLTCKERSMTNNCEQYSVQSTASKIWQRLDNPTF